MDKEPSLVTCLAEALKLDEKMGPPSYKRELVLELCAQVMGELNKGHYLDMLNKFEELNEAVTVEMMKAENTNPMSQRTVSSTVLMVETNIRLFLHINARTSVCNPDVYAQLATVCASIGKKLDLANGCPRLKRQFAEITQE